MSRELDLLTETVQNLFPEGCSRASEMAEILKSSLSCFGLILGKISPLDALNVKRTFSNVFVIFSEATKKLVDEDKAVIFPTGERYLNIIPYRNLAEKLSGLVRN